MKPKKTVYTKALIATTVILLIVLLLAVLAVLDIISMSDQMVSLFQPIVLFLVGVIAILLPKATKNQKSVLSSNPTQGDTLVTIAGVALIGISLITIIMIL